MLPGHVRVPTSRPGPRRRLLGRLRWQLSRGQRPRVGLRRPQTAYASMFEADGGIKVAVQSAAHSANKKLIVPGDAINSFFYSKCAGTMGGSEGLSMPPGDVLTPTELTTLRNWINHGARNN